MRSKISKILVRGILLFSLITVFCLSHHLKRIPQRLKSQCIDQFEALSGKCSEIHVNGRDVYISGTVENQNKIDTLKTRLSKIHGIRILETNLSVEFDSIKWRQINRLSDRYICFPNNSSELDSSENDLLDSLTYLLKRYPKTHLTIRGWADKKGDSSYNQFLSEKRASVVRNALIFRSCDSTRLHTFGFGERWPDSLVMGDSLARRVDFLIEEKQP